MPTIPGASQYLNSATLANQQGVSAVSNTVLGTAEGATSILDVGRSSLFDNGIGLSASARQLNKDFLNSTADAFNSIFSLSLGASATLEGLQQEILAIRARAPESGLSRELQSELNSVDEAELAEVVAAEEEALAASERISELTDTTLSSLSSGDVVDEEA